MSFIKTAPVLAVCLLILTSCLFEESNTVLIRSMTGGGRAYTVEYAVTPSEKSQGLMSRESLPENEGMLFIYERPQIVDFWMKDTLIPLDMLFFNADKTLVHIEHNVQPHDETPRGPDVPVCYVLEINGGQAMENGLDEGAVLVAGLPQECLPQDEKTGKQ